MKRAGRMCVTMVALPVAIALQALALCRAAGAAIRAAAASPRAIGRFALGLSMVVALTAFGGLAIAPRIGGFRTMTVLGGSMEPTIERGAIVMVSPRPAADVQPGQVITFNSPEGNIVTHRVIEVVTREPVPVVRTQGDANEAPDVWQTSLDGPTVWTVTGSVPLVGHAISILRSPLAMKIAIYAVPLLLAFTWMNGSRRRELVPAHG